MPAPRILLLLDRTAVLAVGIVAGFAIGLAFNPGGRSALSGAPPSVAVVPVPVPGPVAPSTPPATGKIPASRPSPAAGAATPPAPVPELAAAAPADVEERVRDAGVVRVGVFGDSFGDGVWAALYNQLPTKRGFKVLRFSKEATGFTRYRQLDLEQRARDQVAGEPIDVAVICFGANDVQPIFADGHLRAILDEGWQKTIGERVDRFIQVARSTGAQVYWVGLPVMRDQAMDQNLVAMDAFFQRHAAAAGVPYLDTRAASLDEHGGYAPYLPDPKTGEPKLMRTGDGIHMTIPGYIRLTRPLADRIRSYAELLRSRAGVPDPAASPTPPSPPAPAGDDAHATASANRHEERRHPEGEGRARPADR